MGLEAQVGALESYLRSHKGRLIATYTEVESGRKVDRVELAKKISQNGSCLNV